MSCLELYFLKFIFIRFFWGGAQIHVYFANYIPGVLLSSFIPMWYRLFVQVIHCGCVCAFPFIIWLPCALRWPMKGKGQMRWIKGAGEGHFHISCGMGLAPGCNLDKWLLIKGLFSVTSTENRGRYSCYMIFLSFKNCFVWSLLYDNPQLSNLGKKCMFSYMTLGEESIAFPPPLLLPPEKKL